MHKLGISVYPEHSTPEKDQAYMESAAGYEFLHACYRYKKQRKK